jgi:hypothetical protein
MSEVASNTHPTGVSRKTLTQLLEQTQGRMLVLKSIVQLFERKYACPLETLEGRLAEGEGTAHPDWEDSVEWRNAVEGLQRERSIHSLLEWLLHSSTPSPA